MGVAGMISTHAFDGWREMDGKPTLEELVTHAHSCGCRSGMAETRGPPKAGHERT